ncbi:hypothetical protein NDU88_003738 [Pleurodeles waltl]|uniref:Uncharacterized protein n=1 Tax=Pleurodeles waltl TaxID=8319 RepID=A0AAV7QDH1_PLEWA|nr:hypothetical protein NDU88_003738 [Pleurodeles waltl]
MKARRSRGPCRRKCAIPEKMGRSEEGTRGPRRAGTLPSAPKPSKYSREPQNPSARESIGGARVAREDGSETLRITEPPRPEDRGPWTHARSCNGSSEGTA